MFDAVCVIKFGFDLPRGYRQVHRIHKASLGACDLFGYGWGGGGGG
jgi:hypothetical protein